MGEDKNAFYKQYHGHRQGLRGGVAHVFYHAGWRSYVAQGWVPKWLYFVKFEGMSEDEAKALCEEAEAGQREKAGLFGAE